MKPRVDVVALDIKTSFSEVLKQSLNQGIQEFRFTSNLSIILVEFYILKILFHTATKEIHLNGKR